MASEIKVSENLQSYAEDFIPATIKIQNFLQQLSALYDDEFGKYRGKANTEVNTYKEDLLKQIYDLSNNYSILSQNLLTIVLEFMSMDEDAETKITSFYTTIATKSGLLEE